jgi:sugar (pentulose or hexulose) kinase
MTTVIGLDIGTTTITAAAIDLDAAKLLAVASQPNDARLSASQGRFEFDADQIASRARQALADVARRLADAHRVAAIGVTGQQHGVVLLDGQQKPISPLINWQDRRGDELLSGQAQSFVQWCQEQLSPETQGRTGCRLASGFMGVTLAWLAKHESLARGARPAFIADYVVASLTGVAPPAEPSMAASSGLFDVAVRDWSREAIAALGLAELEFPQIVEADQHAGDLCAEAAREVGLRAGLPIMPAIGDHQAAFLGSVVDRQTAVHLNVGTGAQISAFTAEAQLDSELEIRPYPLSGNLAVRAVLCGGWSYSVLQKFLQRVGVDVFGLADERELYAVLNQLAERVPRGADGMQCEPLFAGTREDANSRACFSGITAENFTPGHMARALLEGMASVYSDEVRRIVTTIAMQPLKIVGAGGGLRNNTLLVQTVSERSGLPLDLPRYQEEAACGAAIMAAIGVGAMKNLEDVGRLIAQLDS